MKKENRHLKTLLSIGGWTYSPHFHSVVASPPARKNFVATAVEILEDLGLDGLDIDYEYPQNNYQAIGYKTLLKELREALDEHARKKGADYRFLLTVSDSQPQFSASSSINRSPHLVARITTKNSTLMRWISTLTSGT